MSRVPIDDYLDAGRCRIVREVTWKTQFRYSMKCGGAFVGNLDVERRTTDRLCYDTRGVKCSRRFARPTLVGDTRVRVVESIFVSDVARRRGIATKLYEAAAKDACRAAEPLVSALRATDAHSHDFWRKQHAKKRAVVVGARGKEPVYALDCAKGTSLSGVKKPRRKR